MSIHNNEAMSPDVRLFYDVMGIGLSIWGVRGEGELFQFVDDALEAYDIPTMEIIREAFHQLNENQRITLETGTADQEVLKSILSQFEGHLNAVRQNARKAS